MELTDVKGIGPATAVKLKTAGIKNAKDLANASLEDIIAAGIRKATATKIQQNAKDLMGAAKDVPEEKIEKKKPVKRKVKKVTPKEESIIGKVKIPVAYVKGVGPKTRDLLEQEGITSAQELAKASVKTLQGLGLTEKTATKIINNAEEQVGSLSDEVKEEKVAKKPVKEVKVAKKSVKEVKVAKKPVKEVKKEKEEKPPKKKAVKKPIKAKAPKEETESISSPMPQGIPTKKKRGVQVRKTDDYVPTEKPVKKPEGWVVESRQLTPEEIEKKRLRQEEMAKSRKITRAIPEPPVPVKAIKESKVSKGEKPAKVEKVKKKVKVSKKKKQKLIEYYSQSDLYPSSMEARKRGISGKAGKSQPRIQLERNTLLGKITSHRRSRRVVHERQLIVKLEEGFSPDQLVGQKIYFTYPDNEMKVPGSISKRFGKTSSSKVLVNFKKGIRMEGINQKIFIK